MDDEWRFAPDQDTEADKEGNINNFIDLTKFKQDSEALPGRNGRPVVFSHVHGTGSSWLTCVVDRCGVSVGCGRRGSCTQRRLGPLESRAPVVDGLIFA